jgi:hypothetical protein
MPSPYWWILKEDLEMPKPVPKKVIFRFYREGELELIEERSYAIDQVPPRPLRKEQITLGKEAFLVHDVVSYFESPHEVAFILVPVVIAGEDEEKKVPEGVCKYCGDKVPEECPGPDDCNFREPEA